MKTKAVRIYGKNDLRLEEFELPPIKNDEILARVVSDSICMSSYKAARQGAAHKRVPANIARKPTIIGHEFCGRIVEVGRRWRHKFRPGEKFAIQPALFYRGSLDAPGYSYRFIGGDATYIVIPSEVMACGCLLKYSGSGYFPASLAEPLSCVVNAFRSTYHTSHGSHVHKMGIVEGGAMAIIGGAGPMGLGAIDYALHCKKRPGLVVVVDIDNKRLRQARQFFPRSEARKCGVNLKFLNPGNLKRPAEQPLSFTGGKGYDDVFIFVPTKEAVEEGDRILGQDGCLSMFAGPQDKDFSARVNFYKVHYEATHVAGAVGGSVRDIKRALGMIQARLLKPEVMISHIGGLNAVVDTTLRLPGIPGGKKLIYTHIRMPLTAIEDFKKKGKNNFLFRELARLTEDHGGRWSLAAEKWLLKNGEPI